MIVCLVTDRHRMDPVRQAGLAAEAGVDFIQLRERDLDAGPLGVLVSRVVTAVSGSGTRVLVNERLDVALACGAHGVHLRSHSIPPAAARRLAPAGFLVSRSVHGVDEAVEAARGSDFLIAGTLFRTTSKPETAPLLGLEGLRRIAAAVPVPVLAIGGVTADRVSEIAQTGAAGMAAIGLFCSEQGLRSINQRIRLRFDSLKPGS